MNPSLTSSRECAFARFVAGAFSRFAGGGTLGHRTLFRLARLIAAASSSGLAPAGPVQRRAPLANRWTARRKPGLTPKAKPATRAAISASRL
jgi:hypothetical protein